MEMLKGERVLDLTRLLPGPYCTWILSELGADVLKIEDPWEGDYARGTPLYDLINTGKKSLTINLKKDSGKNLDLKNWLILMRLLLILKLCGNGITIVKK